MGPYCLLFYIVRTVVHCFLSFNQFLLHKKTHPLIPWLLSLFRSLWWDILSKVFESMLCLLSYCLLSQRIPQAWLGKTSLCRSHIVNLMLMISYSFSSIYIYLITVSQYYLSTFLNWDLKQITKITNAW